MKGLSTLTTSGTKKKSFGLMKIDQRKSHTLKDSVIFKDHILGNEKCFYPCAYHVGERITNFCMNSGCLLPLCPKCIKVHSQQHERMGVYANYPTIDQCLQQAKEVQFSSIARLEELSQVCQQMGILHQRHIIQSKEQILKAKQELIQYINAIFTIYEIETQKNIQQTSLDYQNQLLLFHKQIITLMANEKLLQKKFHNQNTRMEFIIDFHSKPDITALLNQHASTIDSFKPNYLQLSINTYELQRLKVIIKKYLDFGSFNSMIQQNLENNSYYQRITINPYPASDLDGNLMDWEKTNIREKERGKQFVRSPIKNLWTTPNEKNISEGLEHSTYYEYLKQRNSMKFDDGMSVSGGVREKLERQSRLQNFESPLEAYSLQRSRRKRN